MGWFDWLFGRKKTAGQGSTAAGTPKSSVDVPEPDEDDEEDDFSEATTFISRRLSPIAQREIKNLRTMLAQGVHNFDWSGDACTECKKFLTSGPFRVGDGLTGQAPVPGREGCGGDDCDCAIVPHAD